MPDRSEYQRYQPLPQTADDEPDLEPDVFSTATSPSQPRLRGIRHINAPGSSQGQEPLTCANSMLLRFPLFKIRT